MSHKIRNGIEVDDESVGSDTDENTTASKPHYNLVVIPVIPKPLAIFCLVANVFIPGSGTIVSGCSVFYFYYKKESCLNMANISITNIIIGLCQLITVMFIFIGWFWSIIWGCAIVGHSGYYKKGQLSDSQANVAEIIPSIHLSVKPPSKADNGV